MGTSSSYPGPTGSPPPLLPPWAEDPLPAPPQEPPVPSPPQPDAPPLPTPQPGELPTLPVALPSWSAAKSAVTRFAGGRGILGGVTKSYVRASGGARRAASTSVAGRSSTSRLGGFLSSALRSGIVQAAALLGITDLVGRDAQFVLAAFIDRLAPAGALREEAIARKATIETISHMFERYDVEANGIQALDGMTADDVRAIVLLSITNYVNARFQEELISRVERAAISEPQANQLAGQIREYIETNVILDLGAVDVLTLDWNVAGKQLVDDQYRKAYELLGGGA